MKYFIYLVGANATGKSSMAGWIIETFENSQSVGTYKKREAQGVYTGGADPLRATNNERRQMLQKIWMTDKNLVLMQGMIVLSKLNIDYFIELQEKYHREIIVIHLFCSLNTLQERVFHRSKGNPKNVRRTQNLITKSKDSAKIARYAEQKGLRVINVCCDDIKAYDQLKQKLKELIDE